MPKVGLVPEQEHYDPSVCCVCGSRESRLVARGRPVPVVACTGCGLMRQGIYEREEVGEALAFPGGMEEYIKSRRGKELNQLRDYERALPVLASLLPEKGRLLEIGCAMGSLSERVREQGWEVTGLEPETWSAEIARAEKGIEVINGTLEEADLEEGSFDAVLMFHVIEHVPDPRRCLEKLALLLRAGGVLVMETPRYDTLNFRLLKGRERSVIPGHLHYFSRQTARELAQQTGFVVERLDSVGRTLDLDRLAYNVAKVLHSNKAWRAMKWTLKKLRLERSRVYLNLHDIMRLYLRRR